MKQYIEYQLAQPHDLEGLIQRVDLALISLDKLAITHARAPEEVVKWNRILRMSEAITAVWRLAKDSWLMVPTKGMVQTALTLEKSAVHKVADEAKPNAVNDDYIKTAAPLLSTVIQIADDRYTFKHFDKVAKENKNEIRSSPQHENDDDKLDIYVLLKKMEEFSETEGIIQKPSFSFDQFRKELSYANEKVFILQNGVPGSNVIFPAIKKWLKQDAIRRFCVTHYPMTSPETAKRNSALKAMPVDRDGYRSLPDVIKDTKKTFGTLFGNRGEKVSGRAMRFEFKGTLPYVSYATDYAVWVGALWTTKVTNSGAQLYARKGTEFYENVWNYLDSLWDKKRNKFEWDDGNADIVIT